MIGLLNFSESPEMLGRISEMKPQAATETVGYHRDSMQADVKTFLNEKSSAGCLGKSPCWWVVKTGPVLIPSQVETEEIWFLFII